MKPGEKAEPVPPPPGGTISDTGDLPAGAVAPEGTLGASYGERLEELSRPSAASRTQAPLDLPVIPRERYHELGEHARGGLGRVLRAKDVHLGRPVAIKEMLEAAPGSAASARFVREALVTARLQHPGIVPVYDAGYWPGGEPFYAMKLVSGRSLREAIAGAGDLDARLALLPSVLAAAQAVAYAHSEGVIHRDLKPSNVMLGPFGETVVVDWGLAKDLNAAEAVAEGERPAADVYALSHFDMTRVGAVVGTPGFMSPEQAAGLVVDERTDVYALGAMLYALLAGDTPAPTAPPPIATVAPGAPRDLVAIVDKAMAPAAGARYPDAGAFAADLSRFLSGQLVGAREYGVLTRVARFFSRRRLPLAVSAVLVALLVLVTVEAFRRVVAARGRAEARSNELVLSQARAYLETDPTATLAWLKQYPADGVDAAGAAELAADAVSRGVARHVLYGRHGERLRDARLSPDGRSIALVDDGGALVVDADSGRARRAIALGGLSRVGYAPDGTHLVGLGEKGEVWWIDSLTGVVRRLGQHPSWTQLYAFDASGKHLATTGTGGDVLVFTPGEDAPPRALPALGAQVGAMVFPEEGHLVVATFDGVVREWTDLAAPPRELSRGAGAILALVSDGKGGVFWARGNQIVHHDGVSETKVGQTDATVVALERTPLGDVVSAGVDGLVIGWHGNEARPLARVGSMVTSLAVSEHMEIAVGDEHGNLHLYRNGDLLVLHGHAGIMRRISFRADGALLTSADDGTARLWIPPGPRQTRDVGVGDAFRLVWSRAGDAIFTGTRDGTVRKLAIQGDDPPPLGRQGDAIYTLALSPDEKTLATGSWDGKVALWPLDGGPPRFLDTGSSVSAVAFLSDGRLLSASENGQVQRWDLTTGGHELIFSHGAMANDLVVAADGKGFASAGADGLVAWSLDGAPVRTHDFGREGLAVVRVDRAAATAYVASLSGLVQAWDLRRPAAAPRRLTHHEGHVRGLALSGDERLLASGGYDGIVRVVDLTRGAAVRELHGHTDEVRSVAFSPDSSWLASGSYDGTVRLWDLRDGAVLVLRGHRGKVHRVAFSPDGAWLASVGQDGTLGLWKMAEARLQQSPRRGLGAWLSRTTTATIESHQPLASRPR